MASNMYLNTGYEDMPDNFEDSLIITDPAIQTAMDKLRTVTGELWVVREKTGYGGFLKLFKMRLYDLFVFERKRGRYRLETVSQTSGGLHQFINGIIAAERLATESNRARLGRT